MSIAKQLLLSNNYWTLNKDVVKTFGLDVAIILSVFAEADNLLKDSNGWFFQTIEDIESMTTLKRSKQTNAINELLKLGVITQENRGVPMKRYFKINYDKMTDLLGYTQHSSMLSDNKLKRSKSTDYYKESIDKENTYKDNNINTIVEDKKSYDYKSVIDYLNEKADTNFKNVSGHQSFIKARYNEGYTLDDFKYVIDVKVDEWKNSDKYSIYLRPKTLFGTKFDDYLNQKKVNNGTTRNYTLDGIGTNF